MRRSRLAGPLAAPWSDNTFFFPFGLVSPQEKKTKRYLRSRGTPARPRAGCGWQRAKGGRRAGGSWKEEMAQICHRRSSFRGGWGTSSSSSTKTTGGLSTVAILRLPPAPSRRTSLFPSSFPLPRHDRPRRRPVRSPSSCCSARLAPSASGRRAEKKSMSPANCVQSGTYCMPARRVVCGVVRGLQMKLRG